MTEAALLGRLEKFLDVERRLLRGERGRDERGVRLGDFARRGLRRTEIGRLSGTERCR